MARSQPDRGGWRAYLERFHADAPGITEAVLGATRSNGTDPYRWLLDVVAADATLLDVASGSAPLLAAGWSGPWVGLDRSAAELGVAARSWDRPLVVGDASALPLADGCVDAVACSMALMLIDPIRRCLVEMGRVLTAGGTVAVLLPGNVRSLTLGDDVRWARLLLRLRQTRLSYPNDRALARLDRTLAGTGLRIVDDEQRRFALPLVDADAARRLVDSLYLPGVPDHRVVAARRLAVSWVGGSLGIPLRRVVLSADA